MPRLDPPRHQCLLSFLQNAPPASHALQFSSQVVLTYDTCFAWCLQSVVCCVRFSTDGSKIAAGSHSCVKVFDVVTFRQLYVCWKVGSASLLSGVLNLLCTIGCVVVSGRR